MIDLYAAGTSNGMRARMALEECGLAYKLHPIALDKGENKTAQFLALNPNGQIPVIVDHEGPGGKPLTLSQSTAILIYSAEKSGKFMPKEGAARAAMWQALMSASTDITPTIGSIFAVVRSKDPHMPTANLFKERFRQYLKVWDTSLGRQKYAAGSEMTIADISLYAGWVRIKAVSPDVCEGVPNLERWAAEMAARPAMQRATKF
jgi:GST-like protein